MVTSGGQDPQHELALIPARSFIRLIRFDRHFIWQ